MQRRDFLKQTMAVSALTLPLGASAAKPLANWNSGSVTHLLPTVSDQRILLKASFQSAQSKPPRLAIGKRAVAGQMMDSAGKFWAFDASGLEPARPYEITLVSAAGKPLCDSWTIKTFPAPSDQPKQLRLLIYTCAGGHDALRDEQGRTRFLPLQTRIRLLERGLSFKPDALIANGDHVYWDLRTRVALGASKQAEDFAGKFNRVLSVLGTQNEQVLTRAVGPQVAELYGTHCRSLPVFFIQDDHDYFENDEADDKFVSFPPDDFMLRLARASRRLYYPEFLPDENRPLGLASASAPDSPRGVSESFGTLRYGQLLEALMYDCRRYMTLTGPSATFVPREVEAWLTNRMSAAGVAHVMNIPSTPPGWSAGKWGEWYPDILDLQGKLGASRPKPYWQEGWGAQHDRLLGAASAMKQRIPLFVSGDLHAIAEGRIHRTGSHNLRANPITTILSGPLGTGRGGWPSTFRGTGAKPPAKLEVEEALAPIEENGFIIANFTPEKIAIQFFRWKVEQPEEAIDNLQPFHTLELKRPA
ncbi:MAG: hypothetical protein ACKV2V_20655 [Blastocatellia bacterium]